MANSSVAMPLVACAQAPVLILALANGDGAVANVLALQQTQALDDGTMSRRRGGNLHLPQSFAEALRVIEGDEAVAARLAQPLVEDDFRALEGWVALEGADEGVVVDFVAEVADEAPTTAMRRQDSGRVQTRCGCTRESQTCVRVQLLSHL